jgi:hypothetical protein
MLFVQTHRPLNLRKEKVEKQTWITTFLQLFSLLQFLDKNEPAEF